MVQFRAGGFRLPQAADIIDFIQMGCGIQAAGTIANDYGRAPLHQQFRQGRQQHGMGRTGLTGFHSGKQVGLDTNTHAGCNPIKVADRLQSCPAGWEIVGFTGLQTNFHGRFLHPFCGSISQIPKLDNRQGPIEVDKSCRFL